MATTSTAPSSGRPPTTWHHLAVTFQPNGCRADDANYFDGIVDELRIYDRALTAAEITALATP